MKEKIKKIQLHLQVMELSKMRGMKVSRAAARLGCDSVAAKAHSIAAQTEFFSDADGMVNAVRICGNSCMTSSATAYRYWAETTVDGVRVMAVAVYKRTRCLVRLDHMTYVQAYGENHADLLSALDTLGYEQDADKFSAGLEIPKVLHETAIEEKPFQEQMPVEYEGVVYLKKNNFRPAHRTFKRGEFTENHAGVAYTSIDGKLTQIYNLRPVQKTRAVMRTVAVKRPIKKPYHDGIRAFL
jgi:hypothetical protein